MALEMTAAIAKLVVGATCATLTTLAWAAREAVCPTHRHRYDIIPLAINDDEIELRATKRTLAPGTFGLKIAGQDDPAVLGPVLGTTNGAVRRRLLYRPIALSLQSRCRWSGIVAVTPSSSFVETEVPTGLGPAPAWIVDKGNDLWAIHVHGQGSDRRQTLRGVESASALGLTSLIVSYRNDGEGPRSRDGRSHLGESEWHDLEDALKVVKERGGNSCIIFGWSLGATIALNALHRSELANMIKGVVMVSPVLNWEAAFRANAHHQGWPRFLGSVITSLISSTQLCRLAGLHQPLDIRRADANRFGRRPDVPVLILHSKNDWSVPIEDSVRFAAAHKEQIKLVEFECSGHTQEWNADPVGWDLAVRCWFGKFFQPDRAEAQAATSAGELSDGVGNGWQ